MAASAETRSPARAGAQPSLLYSKRLRGYVGRGVAFLLAAAGAVAFVMPFIWAVSTSLKGDAYLFRLPPQWIPNPILWSNYPKALTAVPFGRFYLNTALITFTALIGDVVVNTVVAYGFARLKFPGRDVLFMVLLASMMLPAQVTMIPVFITFRTLGWINTYYPLIVPAYFGSPFYIFLLRQFFLTIPDDLEHAACIDGASQSQILWRIIVPLAGPAIATVAVFSFMNHWQDYFGPLIYINSPRLKTVALGLQSFREDYGGSSWNLMMAATVVATLPSLAVFFAAQRYFISGIVMTGMRD